MKCLQTFKIFVKFLFHCQLLTIASNDASDLTFLPIPLLGQFVTDCSSGHFLWQRYGTWSCRQSTKTPSLQYPGCTKHYVSDLQFASQVCFLVYRTLCRLITRMHSRKRFSYGDFPRDLDLWPWPSNSTLIVWRWTNMPNN